MTLLLLPPGLRELLTSVQDGRASLDTLDLGFEEKTYWPDGTLRSSRRGRLKSSRRRGRNIVTVVLMSSVVAVLLAALDHYFKLEVLHVLVDAVHKILRV